MPQADVSQVEDERWLKKYLARPIESPVYCSAQVRMMYDPLGTSDVSEGSGNVVEKDATADPIPRRKRGRTLRRAHARTIKALMAESVHPSKMVQSVPSDDPETPQYVFEQDAQCQRLVNCQFVDAILGKCKVTHWDTDCGIRRVFYRPNKDTSDMHHAPVAEVHAWIVRDDLEGLQPSGTRLIWGKRRGLFGCPPLPDDPNEATVTALMGRIQSAIVPADVAHWPVPHISGSNMRYILKASASIFKYGVFVPRNDREADKSPERVQWKAGRNLEWLRLLKIKAFEGNWTKESMLRAYPHISIADIGHVFFIYDFKLSGEHKVRLVYDGSRQPESTYGETFSPTVHPESIRLFHLYCVEHDLEISQYDVPQAFLSAEAEGDIFFYPPPGCADFPGQIFKCVRNLYGGKAAARIFYLKFVKFLTKLGFEADAIDPCFFRRREASGLFSLLICHVDDSRVGATKEILAEIYQALFDEFEITTADGTRFLGMDMVYDRQAGILTLHMATYIKETVIRFTTCDTTVGYPYREICGCLQWICSCCFGVDLMRVKTLASKCNDFEAADFAAALKLLLRMEARGEKGIIFRRGGAKCVRVPDNCRKTGEDGIVTPFYVGSDDVVNELGEKDLYRDDDAQRDAARAKPDFPVSDRFVLVAYTDASFAATEKMQSITGWVVYVNGTPIMYGSLKQTVVVDSSCSAEYVACSITVKKVMELENRLLFLEISCAKPYTVYTDSQAAKAIAENQNSLGNVRHLKIRTHLTRCHISLGDIALAFCITEQMVADLLTKIVTAGQEAGLLDRFFNDCVV